MYANKSLILQSKLCNHRGEGVPHSKSGIVPRLSLLGAGLLKLWEIGKGRDNWVKGGANGVSLQAT
jgi:hypothetical protein